MIQFKQKNIYIGIDIGASTIKAVEVDFSSSGEPILRKANLVPRAEGVRKAVSGMSLKNAKAIAIIDCPITCVRYIKVPIMPDKELNEAIKWEVKDKIPFSLDEAIMNYEVQEEVEESGVRKFKVKVAASPTTTVNNLLNLLGEGGIEPVSLVEPPLSLEHLSRHLNLKKDEATALIDIGCEVTTIAIVKNNLLKFHRKIAFGGGAITKSMVGAFISSQGRIEISEEEAEKIKQDYGIPQADGVLLTEKKIAATQLRSLIRPPLERLLNEIERSLEYYREESGADRVSSIMLFGGGALLKGLNEYLQENLGVVVSVGNPLKGMNAAKEILKKIEPLSCIFAIALGAALSESKGINLLPQALKEKTKRTIKRAGVEAVIAAVIGILILTLIGMRIQLASYNKKIAAGNLELRAVLPQLEIAASYERVEAEIAERQALIKGILSNTPQWKEIFKELSNIVPKEVVFAEMNMEGNTLVIKGEILGGAKNREETLSNFIAALEGKMFKHVSLLTAKMGEKEKGKSEFEIKCVSLTE